MTMEPRDHPGPGGVVVELVEEGTHPRLGFVELGERIGGSRAERRVPYIRRIGIHGEADQHEDDKRQT